MSTNSIIPFLVIGAAGIAFSIGYCLQKYQENYESTLPELFCTRLSNTEVNEERRVINALKKRKNLTPVVKSELTKDTLHRLAYDVNGALFHYSGNCVLLARAILYNLREGANILSVANTHPFFQGIKPKQSDKILFGKDLAIVKSNIQGITALESEILQHHVRTGEIYYIVQSKGFPINLGFYELTVGHHFNAVVLKVNHAPQVQFVDAWKTSNPTPSKQELDKKFRGSGAFCIAVLR